VPAVSDEYSGRLEVTESGEIKYSFPRGFTSRYHGFRAGLRRFTDKLGKGVKVVGKGVFKGWIMVMLVGYFVLFMVLALAALLLSVAASMSGNGRSESKGGGLGGLFLASHIFDLVIRIWFYSELTKSLDPSRSGRPAQKKGKPLFKAIFSFVFGDDDPNADWQAREKQAVISYLQVSKGVISLPEFMNLTGLPPQEADRAITAYCAEFGGSPEATDDGTVVYRFDALLRRADKRDRSFGSSSPLKRLAAFSSNQKNMNVWFSVINGVNLLFGSYFLSSALSTGAVSIVTSIARNGKQVVSLVAQSGGTPSYLYGLTYALSTALIENPLPLITIGLGVVPLVFSLFFWLIPLIRSGLVKKDNERIRMENLRKLGYSRIWGFPRNVKRADIGATVEMDASRPRNLGAAQDRVIKELGSYAVPEVSVADDGSTVYSFTELEREKAALEKYRAGVQATDIGATVFDSE
jgi:hypothetical protein